MTFIFVLVILVVISIAWAIYSYIKLKDIREVGEVKEDLKQGKVIFHSDSLPSVKE